MKKITSITLLSVLLIGCDVKTDTWSLVDFKTTSFEENQHLYFYKGSGSVTHRAKFDHAPDCIRLLQALQQKKSHVAWFCAGKAE